MENQLIMEESQIEEECDMARFLVTFLLNGKFTDH